MKKTFTAPEMNVKVFTAKEVVTTSGGAVGTKYDGSSEELSGYSKAVTSWSSFFDD
ncbi:MAG: hypothetical protein ACI38A_12115 [Candidatus Ornithomonoglobus sp.]